MLINIAALFEKREKNLVADFNWYFSENKLSAITAFPPYLSTLQQNVHISSRASRGLTSCNFRQTICTKASRKDDQEHGNVCTREKKKSYCYTHFRKTASWQISTCVSRVYIYKSCTFININRVSVVADNKIARLAKRWQFSESIKTDVSGATT